MRTSDLKFMPMVALMSMAVMTSCSDDDNNGGNGGNGDGSGDNKYSQELFLSEANKNAVDYDFSNTFANFWVGTIDGGSDLSSKDAFFVSAPYKGAVQASSIWTDGWTLTNQIGGDNKPEQEAVETLNGTLSSGTKVLEANKKYKLSGSYTVKAGATLKIEEGVTLVSIDDNVVDYILVEQGGKIEAEGTAQNPIVMTSERTEPGAWGGVHICGKAHTNVENGTGKSEIGNASYGGNVENDNSGILRYIRIEYAGYAFDEEHEANGFTFYGVGNGTKIDHLQAYRGSDDGFEWFGGSADVRYIVSTSNSDDSFDWTEGWNGRGQFLVAYQEAQSTLNQDCDCLMECDNNGNNFDASPVAHPVLANVTLIGNGGAKQGIRLRAGTQIELYNALVTGKGKCLTTETSQTEKALVNGTSVLNNVYIATGVECNGDE